MVAGEGRDVTALMRLLPGLLAKDGFEGVQLVGLPDGTRRRREDFRRRRPRPDARHRPRSWAALGVDTAPLAAHRQLTRAGRRPSGRALLQATDFLAPKPAQPSPSTKP